MKKIHLLDSLIDFDRARDLPLHAQVRQVLAKIAADHFSPGERFFSEPTLIEHLKVSQGTVRRALADLVQEGRLEKRPAKGTYVSQKSVGVVKKLGVFLPSYDSSFLSGFLEILSKGARKQNRRIEVYHMHKDEDGQNPMDHIHWNPDEGSVILIGNSPIVTWQLHSTLRERGYQVVVVGPRPDSNVEYCVEMDNRAAIEVGLTHLTQLGHRRIAFLLNEPLEAPEILERRDAFLALASEMRLESYPVIDCGTHPWESSFELAYRQCRRVNWLEEGVTAVFASSDPGAWAVLRYCAEEGIKVPHQISVLGIDNVQASAVVYPPLSSVDHPLPEIVEVAMEMATALPPSKVGHIRVRPNLALRASTGQPSIESRLFHKQLISK